MRGKTPRARVGLCTLAAFAASGATLSATAIAAPVQADVPLSCRMYDPELGWPEGNYGLTPKPTARITATAPASADPGGSVALADAALDLVFDRATVDAARGLFFADSVAGKVTSLRFTGAGTTPAAVQAAGAGITFGPAALTAGKTATASLAVGAVGPLKASGPAGTPAAISLGGLDADARFGTIPVKLACTPSSDGRVVSVPVGGVVPAPPTVSGLAPAKGPLAGGTVVTITGTNLAAATGVTFGGRDATSVTKVSATELRATAPAGAAAGKVDVAVITGDGTSANTAADDFTYEAPAPPPPAFLPVVSGVSPTRAYAGFAPVVAITGQNLQGAEVRIGGIVSAVVVSTPGRLVVVGPALRVGTYDVRVTTDNGSATAATKIRYVRPF